MKTFWHALETTHGLVALPVTWRNKTGETFEPFCELCLRPCDWLAQSYPCPLVPGCALRLVAASTDGVAFRAVPSHLCVRNPTDCPHIQLARHEIIPFELNWAILARAISKALGLDTKITKLPIPHTMQIGSWSADAVPVILTIQTERRHFRQVVCELIARLHQRFILLSPTSQHFDALSLELLAAANSVAFALENIVNLSQSGNLQPTKTPGELFAKFNPEEKLPEDAALRAFAVLKSMDTDRRLRKASIFTVFRLYCMENLSAEAIAKRLGCGKTTVIERLKLIRQKTGTDPANLRAYSAQFTRIEQSLADPRARRIAPKSASGTSENEQER
jgi:hypothetical protein